MQPRVHLLDLGDRYDPKDMLPDADLDRRRHLVYDMEPHIAQSQLPPEHAWFTRIR